eukprot:9457949-Lingulodinium_polyedra.AAC.2
MASPATQRPPGPLPAPWAAIRAPRPVTSRRTRRTPPLHKQGKTGPPKRPTPRCRAHRTVDPNTLATTPEGAARQAHAVLPSCWPRRPAIARRRPRQPARGWPSRSRGWPAPWHPRGGINQRQHGVRRGTKPRRQPTQAARRQARRPPPAPPKGGGASSPRRHDAAGAATRGKRRPETTPASRAGRTSPGPKTPLPPPEGAMRQAHGDSMPRTRTSEARRGGRQRRLPVARSDVLLSPPRAPPVSIL